LIKHGTHYREGIFQSVRVSYVDGESPGAARQLGRILDPHWQLSVIGSLAEFRECG